MDKELKDLLERILANQAVIFHRIDELYHNNPKSVKSQRGHDEKRAGEELYKFASKLLEGK